MRMGIVPMIAYFCTSDAIYNGIDGNFSILNIHVLTKEYLEPRILTIMRSHVVFPKRFLLDLHVLLALLWMHVLPVICWNVTKIWPTYYNVLEVTLLHELIINFNTSAMFFALASRDMYSDFCYCIEHQSISLHVIHVISLHVLVKV